MYKQIFTILLSLLVFTPYSFGLEIVPDHDLAIELGRKEQKNVLTIFSLENCVYCDMLKNDLVHIENINHYIVCILDSKKHKKLTGKMNIRKWPTSVITVVGIENQGEASRLVGYKNKQEYESWLKKHTSVFTED